MLDVKLLRESISYDPTTGVCIWLERPRYHFDSDALCNRWNGRFAGKQAGSKAVISKKPYWKIEFCGLSTMLHRVIWAIVTGSWPDNIDHDDGNGRNNAWVNLNNTNSLGNSRNRRRYLNRELPTGVRYNKNKKRYKAYIHVDNGRIELGTFDDLASAVKARKNAEIEFGFNPNHGQIRPL